MADARTSENKNCGMPACRPQPRSTSRVTAVLRVQHVCGTEFELLHLELPAPIIWDLARLMPCATLVGSVRIASSGVAVIQSLWYTVRSINSAAATETRE